MALPILADLNLTCFKNQHDAIRVPKLCFFTSLTDYRADDDRIHLDSRTIEEVCDFSKDFEVSGWSPCTLVHLLFGNQQNILLMEFVFSR